MAQLTQQELSDYSKLLENEDNTIKKYKAYAQMCSEPGISELCENFAQRHTQHYNALLKQLQKSGE